VFLAAMIAVFGICGSGRAQDSKRDELSVSIYFGWQDQMPVERWAPIMALISAGDSSLSGSLVAEYEQDATNLARYSTPFATTPGAATQVQVQVVLPAMCYHVRLSVVSDSGETLWVEDCRLGSSAAQPLPTLLRADMPIVGVVGRSWLPEAFAQWPGIVAIDGFGDTRVVDPGAKHPLAARSDFAWSHAAAVHADVGKLPTTWIGYDGLAVLVVIPDESHPPDPRAVEAIHRWVEAGGRLVIQADAPGEAWRDWMPSEMASHVEVSAAVRDAAPAQAQDAITRIARRIEHVRRNEVPNAATPGTEGNLPVAAETVQLRPLHLTEAGKKAGWMVLWPFGDSAAVVEGQLGFGSVALVGFDPAKTMELASGTGTGAVWRAVLEPIAMDYLERVLSPYDARYGYGYNPATSQAANNAALERVAKVPGLGESVVIMLLACILLLGGMVGPLDYFVLRRMSALQRSWVTAMGWILIASVLAYVGPRVIRAEPTRVNRVSVEDCIALPLLDGAPERVAALGGPVAMRSGLTGIYAGDSGVAHFASADATSWWRGVTAQNENQVSVPNGKSLLPIVQKAAGGASGSGRGGALTDLPVALWTFRTFVDESSPPASIRARIRETGEGWSVVIAGLPGKARVTTAALRVGDKWCTPTRESRVRNGTTDPALPDAPSPGRASDLKPDSVGSMDDGVWSASFPLRYADPLVPRMWGALDVVAGYSFGPAPTDMRPGPLLDLYGPARRSRAIDKAVESARWGAVYLDVADWPVDTSVTWRSEGEQTRVLRVLVPLGEEVTK
jgi:hypothetical protein